MYRPQELKASNLQFVSKVIGIAVFDQLHKHLEDNDLQTVFQSVYKKQHRTETALLRVVSDILCNTNRQHVALLVLLDLSAARSQHVIVNGEQSVSLDLPFGAPLGSCLGPFLFSL